MAEPTARAANEPAGAATDASGRYASVLDGQKRALELALQGAPLADVLEVLVRAAEAQSDSGFIASILLLDAAGARLRHGAAPGLPGPYNAAIDGAVIGPAVGSCGSAAFLRQTVIVRDIASDPRWVDYRDLALAQGLRACWSTPFFSERGEVLGTFALYYREASEPTPLDLKVVGLLASTAALVVERQRRAEERAASERALGAAKEAAEAARAHLHALFMQAPAPICILRGPSHRFELANPLFLQVVGKGEVVGRGVAELVPEAAVQGLVGLLDRVYATGERHVGREAPLHFDGRGAGGPEARVMNFVYEPFRDPDGAIAGILVVAFDVSDGVRAREAIERANAAKDQFLATVSHELRTPLNSILGWAALLRAADAPRDLVGKGLETIERNARAQAQLIEDLLDVSRIQAGKLKLEPSAVFVPSVCEAALDTARPAAAAKNLRLEADVDAEVGSLVADPGRLQQVIWNLVSNAVKFTPPGGTVRVSAGRAGDQLVLAVSDTGRGISPEFLPFVFERFQQAQPSGRKTGGLGLGLAIVRQIVELHGGTVSAESEGEGRGATFTVRLPIRATFRPGPALADEGGPPQPAPPSGPWRALEGARLLVVDDQEDAREMLAMILAEAGAHVRSASSADEAVRLFREERPDALVSDLGMPGKDGYALIRELRALPEGRRMPALALTAYARSEDRVRALAAGFSLHVAKPVEPTELVLALARALGREVSIGEPCENEND